MFSDKKFGLNKELIEAVKKIISEQGVFQGLPGGVPQGEFQGLPGSNKKKTINRINPGDQNYTRLLDPKNPADAQKMKQADDFIKKQELNRKLGDVRPGQEGRLGNPNPSKPSDLGNRKIGHIEITRGGTEIPRTSFKGTPVHPEQDKLPKFLENPGTNNLSKSSPSTFEKVKNFFGKGAGAAGIGVGVGLGLSGKEAYDRYKAGEDPKEIAKDTAKNTALSAAGGVIGGVMAGPVGSFIGSAALPHIEKLKDAETEWQQKQKEDPNILDKYPMKTKGKISDTIRTMNAQEFNEQTRTAPMPAPGEKRGIVYAPLDVTNVRKELEQTYGDLNSYLSNKIPPGGTFSKKVQIQPVAPPTSGDTSTFNQTTTNAGAPIQPVTTKQTDMEQELENRRKAENEKKHSGRLVKKPKKIVPPEENNQPSIPQAPQSPRPAGQGYNEFTQGNDIPKTPEAKSISAQDPEGASLAASMRNTAPQTNDGGATNAAVTKQPTASEKPVYKPKTQAPEYKEYSGRDIGTYEPWAQKAFSGGDGGAESGGPTKKGRRKMEESTSINFLKKLNEKKKEEKEDGDNVPVGKAVEKLSGQTPDIEYKERPQNPESAKDVPGATMYQSPHDPQATMKRSVSIKGGRDIFEPIKRTRLELGVNEQVKKRYTTPIAKDMSEDKKYVESFVKLYERKKASYEDGGTEKNEYTLHGSAGSRKISDPSELGSGVMLRDMGTGKMVTPQEVMKPAPTVDAHDDGGATNAAANPKTPTYKSPGYKAGETYAKPDTPMSSHYITLPYKGIVKADGPAPEGAEKSTIQVVEPSGKSKARIYSGPKSDIPQDKMVFSKPGGKIDTKPDVYPRNPDTGEEVNMPDIKGPSTKDPELEKLFKDDKPVKPTAKKGKKVIAAESIFSETELKHIASVMEADAAEWNKKKNEVVSKATGPADSLETIDANDIGKAAQKTTEFAGMHSDEAQKTAHYDQMRVDNILSKPSGKSPSLGFNLSKATDKTPEAADALLSQQARTISNINYPKNTVNPSDNEYKTRAKVLGKKHLEFDESTLAPSVKSFLSFCNKGKLSETVSDKDNQQVTGRGQVDRIGDTVPTRNLTDEKKACSCKGKCKCH